MCAAALKREVDPLHLDVHFVNKSLIRTPSIVMPSMLAF